MLTPRQQVPNISLLTLDHGTFTLSKETSERGTLLCFYRGLHCPLCATYLTELEKRTDDFAERGVGTIAISSDQPDRARAMAEKIGAEKLRIAYDLQLDDARDWGLYISAGQGRTSIGLEEPELFSEPGLFMVTPQRSLYFGSVQTMPFVRPHFSELVSALDFVIKSDYPARGEYAGPVNSVLRRA